MIITLLLHSRVTVLGLNRRPWSLMFDYWRVWRNGEVRIVEYWRIRRCHLSLLLQARKCALPIVRNYYDIIDIVGG